MTHRELGYTPREVGHESLYHTHHTADTSITLASRLAFSKSLLSQSEDLDLVNKFGMSEERVPAVVNTKHSRDDLVHRSSLLDGRWVW